MKKINKIALWLLTGFLVYACNKNYLDKRPNGELDEQFIINKKGVEGLLIGAYSLLDGIGGNKSDVSSAGSNWIYGSVCGSEAYTGSIIDDGDVTLERFTATGDDASLAGKWGTVYDGVARSNDVLRIMGKAQDITLEDQSRISGEARFLRAFYHFEAKKMWKNVPFIDETITYNAGNYHVPNTRDIWPDIENDLKFAIENLGDNSFSDQPGRANKYTAKALLAKAFMFQQKFDSARAVLTEIINSGKYELNKSFHDNFDAATKNSKESILAAQSSVNDGANGENGNYGDVYNFPTNDLPDAQPGNCCGFFPPSQYLVNHFRTDSVTGLPLLDTYNEQGVKSDQNIFSQAPFNPDSGTLDPRLDWTVGRRGIPYLDWGLHPGERWIRNQQYSGPYTPIKNVFPKQELANVTDAKFWGTNATANNVNLIRYADVLLWAAEAETEVGSLNQAEVYVNLVRNRMADPAYWVHTFINDDKPADGFTTTPAAHYFIKPYPDGYFTAKGKTEAMKAIRFERTLELAMEGQRFFDLVRWGIADTEITSYIAKEKLLRNYFTKTIFIKGKHEYFAIPTLQIDLSAGADGVPQMLQNPGY